MEYNKYITSIDKSVCVDCKNAKFALHHDKYGKLMKKCTVCGKVHHFNT